MGASVLAVGAWLKNRACRMGDDGVEWSELHGDLSDPQACAALESSVQALIRSASSRGRPVRAIAHDWHPDFFSTWLALRMADTLGVAAVGVQHHHAHLAAVMAEHGIEAPALGLALDGVGLGTDGAAWGGELLWTDGATFERLGHLQPLALPGGDRAAREPWRMAASVLHALGRGDEIVPRFVHGVGAGVAAGVQQLLQRGLNCPTTSSAGRWFDAAAAALGLCLRQTDEAQAAVALERVAAAALAQWPQAVPLPGAVVHPDGCVDLRTVVAPLFDIRDPRDVGVAAAGFHLALADALCDALLAAARVRGVRHALLGGGCFFNRILRERCVQRLQAAGMDVFLPGAMGCGDAGLAIGQAWVAAHRLALPRPRNVTKEFIACV
ncbi:MULTISPECIES: carbamoyltransferase HypF [unclassified Tepidimonas]|jgi:hydrogenase maturation protein HypF|uniref:Kae1-like domain-containing protein n=2 Tax=Tepidimonas TaxID=114248 RepID=UPI003C7DBE0B